MQHMFCVFPTRTCGTQERVRLLGLLTWHHIQGRSDSTMAGMLHSAGNQSCFENCSMHHLLQQCNLQVQNLNLKMLLHRETVPEQVLGQSTL